MKIHLDKISIKQYRSCKQCEFAFDRNLNALIGPNGSGKTTILRAIYILRQLVWQDSFFNEPEEESEPTQIKVWLDVDGKKVIHTIELFIETDESNNDRIVSSEEKWYLKDFTGDRSLLKLPLQLVTRRSRAIQRAFVFEDSGRLMIPRRLVSQVDFRALENPEIVKLFSSIAEFYEGITYYSASQFTNPSKCPVSIEIIEDKPIRNRRIRDEHSKWLYNLYDIRETDLFGAYLDIVGSNGMRLVEDISFNEVDVSSTHVTVKIRGKFEKQQRKQKIVIPRISIGGSILSPTQLSEGTFKTLAMVFYLMTGKGNIVLLEEPEVCIHHGLLSSIIELVKEYSKDKQIFLTTHSDYILDELDPSNVVVVQRSEEGGTSAKSLKSYLRKEDLSALKKFLNEEGSLGEYWRIGGIENE